MPKVNGLTDKQRRFVEEYLVDCNATDAARRAGYSKRGARASGQQNMSNYEVKAEIDRRMAQKSQETGYTRERVAQMLVDAYDMATAEKQASAAVQAANGLAKLHGLIIDKTQHSGNALGDFMASISGYSRMTPADDDSPTVQ